MKRELKFRAWSGKEMRYNVNINDGQPVRKGYQWFNYSNDVHDSEPMLYTGVNDKNGKDIYANDIIKDALTGAIMRVHFGYNRNGNYTGWYCSYLNIDCNGNCSLSNDDDRDYNSHIEVIGNSFENPDLL